MLRRLHANLEAEVATPVFDRSLEVARAGARIIPKSVRHLIVEGNYLLLDRAPWQALLPLFDTTVLIEVEFDVLRERLIDRWRGYGLTAVEIAAKLESDLANARLVTAESIAAEFHISANIDGPTGR
jgi:pantothenate kinase